MEDLEGFVERYTAAWNECDTAAMGELIAADIVWADPALPEPARGIAAVQEFMRASFRTFPDLRFGEQDPVHRSVAGDQVATSWTMTGTMLGPADPPGFAPTGKAMVVDGVDLWQMRDGKIARYRAYYDLNDLVRQLGIIPAEGSRAERATVALQRLQARLQRGR